MLRQSILFIILLLIIVSCYEPSVYTNTAALAQPEGQEQALDTTGMQKAIFAGGCFWCTEAYFERVNGVKAVVSGYAGGTKRNPTYEQVSAGLTDYAEAVQVYYDSTQVKYNTLLEVFFATHDPTTLNRQGPDVGKQYRSIVFYKTPKEKAQTEHYIGQLNEAGTFPNKVVTTVEPFKKFWVAEGYHQDYYRLNPDDMYVVSVAMPKVKKFEKNFQHLLKPAYKAR